MQRFFLEWGRLLIAPLPLVGRPAALLKFLGPTAAAAILSVVLTFFGEVSGWILALVALLVFHFSLTAGMGTFGDPLRGSEFFDV